MFFYFLFAFCFAFFFFSFLCASRNMCWWIAGQHAGWLSFPPESLNHKILSPRKMYIDSSICLMLGLARTQKFFNVALYFSDWFVTHQHVRFKFGHFSLESRMTHLGQQVRLVNSTNFKSKGLWDRSSFFGSLSF